MKTSSHRSAFETAVAFVAPVVAGLAFIHCSASAGSAGGDGAGDPVDSATGGNADSATDGGAALDGPSHDAGSALDTGSAVDPRTPCDAADSCEGTMQCCGGFCADTQHDPRNCGSCGTACSATQFCTGTACDEAVFSNVCANPATTVVNDPYTTDIQAGVAIGMALVSCSDAGVAVDIVPQTKPGVLQPMGDAGQRPNTGVGDTLVAGGSWWGQLSVAYMDNSGLTPVYLTNDGTTSHFFERSTGLPLVTTLDSALTTQHDYFFLELAVEPMSGTLCLFGEGILGPGTAAAGYYGSQVVVPGHATYLTSYYVYEWTDTSGDGVPGAGDTFALIAQGS
jgi:hypothetical protein